MGLENCLLAVSRYFTVDDRKDALEDLKNKKYKEAWLKLYQLSLEHQLTKFDLLCRAAKLIMENNNDCR